MSQNVSIHWFPLLSGWSIALIAASLFGLLGIGCWLLVRKQVPRRWIARFGAMRTLAVLLFIACLLQPAVSYRHTTTKPPEMLLLIDASQSMGQSDASEGRTRLAAGIEELRKNSLLESLGKDFQLHWFAFDRNAYPIDANELDALQPRGTATEFARSVTSAVDLLDIKSDVSSSRGLPQRVLLLSDGQDQGSEDLADAAVRLGVAVDVIVAGEERTAPPKLTSVRRVQAAQRVLLGSETQFLVSLERGTNSPANYTLALFESGKEVLTQEVSFADNTTERQVKVSYRPTETGLHRYEFVLSADGADVAAKPEEADCYGVNVQVVDDKIEVLVLEDRWRWEFKYFRRVLEDDPSFNLTAMLARGGGAFVQVGEPERQVNLGSFPQGRNELEWFDVIVLGDVHPSHWPNGLSGALADSVIEGGKSLVLIAGPGLDELARVPELHTLLPVELTRESAAPVEGPLSVELTPEGAKSALFADGGRGVLSNLPAIDRIYPPLRKRSGATILVEATQEANAAGRLIVIAEQTVGRGRVLYVGTDALWKWQSMTAPDEQGRTLYGKFWQQALRSLTPRRTSGTALWLQSDSSRYETGNRVTLRAEMPAGMNGEEVKLQATVVLPDERRMPLAFSPDPTTADAFTAQFEALSPGRYRVSLNALVDGQSIAEASTAVEVTLARAELDSVGIDRARLERIAARTGGKVIDPADIKTWPTTDKQSLQTVEERQSVNLLNNFSLIVLLCLVLGTDWLLRLLRGFV